MYDKIQWFLQIFPKQMWYYYKFCFWSSLLSFRNCCKVELEMLSMGFLVITLTSEPITSDSLHWLGITYNILVKRFGSEKKKSLNNSIFKLLLQIHAYSPEAVQIWLLGINQMKKLKFLISFMCCNKALL